MAHIPAHDTSFAGGGGGQGRQGQRDAVHGLLRGALREQGAGAPLALFLKDEMDGPLRQMQGYGAL